MITENGLTQDVISGNCTGGLAVIWAVEGRADWFTIYIRGFGAYTRLTLFDGVGQSINPASSQVLMADEGSYILQFGK